MNGGVLLLGLWWVMNGVWQYISPQIQFGRADANGVDERELREGDGGRGGKTGSRLIPTIVNPAADFRGIAGYDGEAGNVL